MRGLAAMFLRLEKMERKIEQRDTEKPQSPFELAECETGSDGMKRYMQRTIFFITSHFIQICHCVVYLIII